MTIYKKRTPSQIYRKIYEQHYGPIPKDDNGRSHEIHHIDGDDSNNDPTNLVALSIQEHYNIHYSQGDWGACFFMAKRMNLSHSEKSELARKTTKTRVENGTHPWLKRSDGTSVTSDRVEDGTHNWISGELQRKTQQRRIKVGDHVFLDEQWQKDKTKKQVENGTHNFITRSDGTSLQQDRVKNGTHNFSGENSPTQQKWSCSHCGKTGKGITNFTRWHGDNCKHRHSSS